MFLLLLGCPKKEAAPPPPPPEGWHKEEAWTAECWFPPDFAQLESTGGISTRREARQKTLEAMMLQWSGGKGDGVSFPSNVTEDIETTLLGRPEQIEAVAVKNLEFCKAFASGGGDTAAWANWAANLPEQLTAGECLVPLTYTLFDYLDIGAGWQLSVPLCAGDVARIEGTTQDRYKITAQGDWMTVEGNGVQAKDEQFPCLREGCTEGMLIGRFVSDSGVEEIFPIGDELLYTATANGTLSVMINDHTFYDNVYYKTGGLEDHAGITISPGK